MNDPGGSNDADANAYTYDDADDGDPGTFRYPRWPAVIGLVLCLAGLGASAYLTYAHFDTSIKLACPDTGIVNCAKVTTSKYSHILGIPVALLGLLFFTAMIPLQLPVAWRSDHRLIRSGRVTATVVGMGFVMWLLFAELYRIHNICLWCTAVHTLTFGVFVLTVLGTLATAAVPAD